MMIRATIARERTYLEVVHQGLLVYSPTHKDSFETCKLLFSFVQQQSETVLKFYIAQARRGPAEIPKVLTHHFEQKSFFHCCGFAAGLAQSNVGKTINHPMFEGLYHPWKWWFGWWFIIVLTTLLTIINVKSGGERNGGGVCQGTRTSPSFSWRFHPQSDQSTSSRGPQFSRCFVWETGTTYCLILPRLCSIK